MSESIYKTEDLGAESDASEQANSISPIPTELEELLTTLERDNRRRQRWANIILGAFAFSAVGLLVASIIAWWITGRFGGYLRYYNYLYLISLAGWGLGAFCLNRGAVVKLAQRDDLRCIEPLINVLATKGISYTTVNYSPRMRKAAKKALTRLLPRLKASDAPLLR